MRKVLNDSGDVEKEERLKVLDVAGGTGDISFRILNKAKQDSPNSKIVHIYMSLYRTYS
jgi:ubiquinone/menaquinone biosynthesis C-methylase UbiE